MVLCFIDTLKVTWFILIYFFNHFYALYHKVRRGDTQLGTLTILRKMTLVLSLGIQYSLKCTKAYSPTMAELIILFPY